MKNVKKALFVAVAFCCLNLSAVAQNFTLKMNDVTVKQAIDELKNKSGYSFVFFSGELDTKKKISITAEEATLDQVVKQILSGQQVSYTIEGKNIVIKKVQSPQQKKTKTITGVIKDEAGQPVIGANVVEKGTINGAVTDVDGKYTLQVSEGSLLVVSYIGYVDKEIQVGSHAVVDVLLAEDMQALDEVVVVGYGVVRKSDLTGSVSRVSSEKLNNLPVSSIDKALQGRAAGVQISSLNGAPGAGASVRIRGGNSISANNEPLYVIDGFIGGGDLNSLNPSDIESIEILKDAAATSIYGSRGANGVIMITTKKGKEGVNKINVGVYQGWQSLPRKLPFMEGEERARFANDYAAFNQTSPIFPDMSKVTNTDWQDEITRTAAITNADISISGGNKDFQHYISGNYFNQDGIYKSSGFTRYQVRINLDKKLFDFLKVGIQTNASSLRKENAKVDYYDGMRKALTCMPVKDENGRYTNANPVNGELFDNPVAMNEWVQNDTYSKRFLGNFNVEQ